jgi:hypothetical protein
MNTVLSEIKKLNTKYLRKFENHTNALAVNLLDNSETTHRLKSMSYANGHKSFMSPYLLNTHLLQILQLFIINCENNKKCIVLIHNRMHPLKIASIVEEACLPRRCITTFVAAGMWLPCRCLAMNLWLHYSGCLASCHSISIFRFSGGRQEDGVLNRAVGSTPPSLNLSVFLCGSLSRCRPYAPTAIFPPERFLVVDPRAIVRLKGLGKLKPIQ